MEEQLKQIKSDASKYDVIAFQELFNPLHMHAYIEALKDEWPYYVTTTENGPILDTATAPCNANQLNIFQQWLACGLSFGCTDIGCIIAQPTCLTFGSDMWNLLTQESQIMCRSCLRRGISDNIPFQTVIQTCSTPSVLNWAQLSGFFGSFCCLFFFCAFFWCFFVFFLCFFFVVVCVWFDVGKSAGKPKHTHTQKKTQQKSRCVDNVTI